MGAIVVTDWTLAEYTTVRYAGPLGLVGQPVTEYPCLCGQTITVLAGDSMPNRVRAHVLSDPHASWSRRTFPERHP